MLYLVVSLLISAITAQQIQDLECPDQIFEGFDPAQYQGKWYEITNFNNGLEDGLSCISNDYQLVGSSMYAEVSMLYESARFRKRHLSYNVRLDPKNESSPADMKSVILYDSTEDEESFEYETSDYVVLYTDYTKYAVVYSCDSYNGTRIINTWILSREPTPDFGNDTETAVILSKLQEIDVEISDNLLNVPQADCDEDLSQYDYDVSLYDDDDYFDLFWGLDDFDDFDNTIKDEDETGDEDQDETNDDDDEDNEETDEDDDGDDDEETDEDEEETDEDDDGDDDEETDEDEEEDDDEETDEDDEDDEETDEDDDDGDDDEKTDEDDDEDDEETDEDNDEDDDEETDEDDDEEEEEKIDDEDVQVDGNDDNQ